MKWLKFIGDAMSQFSCDVPSFQIAVNDNSLIGREKHSPLDWTETFAEQPARLVTTNEAFFTPGALYTIECGPIPIAVVGVAFGLKVQL